MFAALHMVYVKYIHWSTFYNMLQYRIKRSAIWCTSMALVVIAPAVHIVKHHHRGGSLLSMLYNMSYVIGVGGGDRATVALWHQEQKIFIIAKLLLHFTYCYNGLGTPKPKKLLTLPQT